jgi:centrosomal protein CEP164
MKLLRSPEVMMPKVGEAYKAEDGTVSTVLDDADDYEPTQQDVVDYAQWLGMQLPEDEGLLWIAREALRAPLPLYWKACRTDEAEVYYFNFKTGEAIWDHPRDDHFKEKYQRLKRLHEEKNLPGK